MSDRQATDLPTRHAKRVLKRKPGEEARELVAEAAPASDANPGDAAGAAGLPAETAAGHGLGMIEGLAGLVGVGVVGTVAMGMREERSAGAVETVTPTKPVVPVVVVDPVKPVVVDPVKPVIDPVKPAVIEPVRPVVDPVKPVVVDPVRPVIDPVGPVIVEPVRPVVDPVMPGVVDPVKPVVDTRPPEAPQLSLKRDTGDRNTSDSTISVSGLEEGATWRYRWDGKDWHDGRGFEIAEKRLDGKHEVQVIQIDQAGNASAAASLQFTLDTGAPTLSLKNDTGRMTYDEAAGEYVLEDGAHGRDGITKDGTLSVSGLRDGAIWQFSLDEGRSWRAGSGNEIEAREMGADGRKTVWVGQKDKDGESGLSSFSFVLDTHAGELFPRLKSFEFSDRENRPVTSEPVIVFDGFEEGAVARWVMYGGQPWGMIGSGSSSTTEVSFVGKVPGDGSQLRFLYQEDIAGNLSPYSPDFHFVVAPSDAGNPGPRVPPSDSIFP